MLRLDATVIRLSLSEINDYGRNRHSKDQCRRRADTDQLSTTISPKTGWRSLYEAIDSPLTYPSNRMPLVLPHNLSTASEGLEISTGGGNGSGGDHNDKNNNHNKADKPSSIDANETMAMTIEQHTDPTGCTFIPRPPLPPPFAATPRVSSPLYQPSTPIRLSRAIELKEAIHVAPPALISPSARSPTLTSPYGPGTHHTAAVTASLQRLVIYDDTVAAEAQPQTPRNVPEVRHESRSHGSYTAPSSRTFTLETSTLASRSHRHRRRAEARSPARMNTPGFVGLYGGLENSDEAVLYDAEMWRWLASHRDV
ncbi:uncharacterized protein LY79DRAFT_573026 [Colletotrichum navitas]|uniref:Uncharacterized protein n=1 Tax=Colletotrichum navitas TaxID=681940 RepID=A0AAD8PJP6_9PEZI|nr:uncharacterized protein LY79DRAFT_573026 [Colletotrichum navitas]KAK1565988.1 hypothetical protein LY79DRAFT_573026 [Colletotrichum navitas]